MAFQDPRTFLNRYPNGAILDEVQRAPLLLNYLQEILDNTEEDGLFVLTGSNNMLLQYHITQTLAGRIGVNSGHFRNPDDVFMDNERKILLLPNSMQKTYFVTKSG